MDESRATINSVFQHKGSTKSNHVFVASLDWATGKYGDIEKELQTAAEEPDGVFAALNFRETMAIARGEMKQARDYAHQFEEALDRVHLKGQADIEASLSVNEALVGHRPEAETLVNGALKQSQTLRTLSSAATTFSILHEDQKALALASQIEREHPNDTIAINVTVPEIRAIVALRPANSARVDAAKAIDSLNSAAVYARADQGILFARGLAYEQAERYAEAQQDLEKVLATASQAGPDLTFALAQLESGRVYQKQGDLSKARIAYQNFLASWKDADPDLPLLLKAKAEYAKLQ
jgi:tetratricopeptide (TPR) repeat protein